MRSDICLVLAMAALASGPAWSAPDGAPTEYHLITSPEHVYFTTSNAKERVSASIFFLVVEASDPKQLTTQSLTLKYLKGGKVVRTDTIDQPLLTPIAVAGPATKPATSAFYRPLALRLHLTLPEPPLADSVEARLTFVGNGREQVATATIPIQAYEQKTSLIFPFVGNGLISAAGALYSGHRNRSGLYAIDALGLTPNYGPMKQPTPEDDPANHAGWGREIIAPAAGTVVVARNDHVGQPVAGNSDPAYYLPQYKDGGDPGNLVVIDHGDGEFSMIAHMQKGSVRVKVGDRVAQGQVIGLLGNSGDTSGPHVHYQLQSGPDWERSDALPFHFTNVQRLTPGTYFSAELPKK
jgi:murein DD-endopeptidase MepM/ murein hydrolase activator NlpD